VRREAGGMQTRSSQSSPRSCGSTWRVKVARREAVTQSAEERAKAKLERERFRSTTQRALDPTRNRPQCLQRRYDVGNPTDAERQKQPMTRWQILQQTQAKMLEIARTADKAKLSDAAFKKWDGYVRQA
jgi:hypothetical protein